MAADEWDHLSLEHRSKGNVLADGPAAFQFVWHCQTCLSHSYFPPLGHSRLAPEAACCCSSDRLPAASPGPTPRRVGGGSLLPHLSMPLPSGYLAYLLTLNRHSCRLFLEHWGIFWNIQETNYLLRPPSSLLLRESIPELDSHLKTQLTHSQPLTKACVT